MNLTNSSYSNMYYQPYITCKQCDGEGEWFDDIETGAPGVYHQESIGICNECNGKGKLTLAEYNTLRMEAGHE